MDLVYLLMFNIVLAVIFEVVVFEKCAVKYVVDRSSVTIAFKCEDIVLKYTITTLEYSIAVLKYEIITFKS